VTVTGENRPLRGEALRLIAWQVPQVPPCVNHHAWKYRRNMALLPFPWVD
jgi:hypothetical protein